MRTCLNLKDRAKYILDCDIKGFFDNIDHKWILKNIPLPKNILKEWLKAKIIFQDLIENNITGVPQRKEWYHLL